MSTWTKYNFRLPNAFAPSMYVRSIAFFLEISSVSRSPPSVPTQNDDAAESDIETSMVGFTQNDTSS
jgi:hypothetical protein